MSETAEIQKHLSFIPDEAALLLEPVPGEYTPGLPEDPIDRGYAVLATSVDLVAAYMNKHEKIIGNGVARVMPMYTKGDKARVIRIEDESGTTQLNINPAARDPKRLLTASIKSASGARETIELDEVQSSHWQALAGAKEAVLSASEETTARRGRFLSRLIRR